MLNNISDSFNNKDIITKSQMYEQMSPDTISSDSFAKTINYQGIHYNFCLDKPEIIEEEKRRQEYREDVKKFTRLAMSDIENESHNDLVKKVLGDSVILDVYNDEIMSDLATNEQLLNDIGLL